MAIDPYVFEEIESQLDRLDIDEIKRRIGPLMRGYALKLPIFDPGIFIYRARRFGESFKKADKISRRDLIQPPASAAKIGRANRAGSPVFYGGIGKESIFFEIPGLKAGDELLVSFWQTSGRMLLSNIGYTEFAFKQLGARRPIPQWFSERPGTASDVISTATLTPEVADMLTHGDDHEELKHHFGNYFTRSIVDGGDHFYKMTTAISELHLGNILNNEIQFAGIIYPSVRMLGNGDNVALHPWFVDEHLLFRKAVHIRVKDVRENAFDIDNIDTAHLFDDEGNLVWLGRLKNWTLQSGQSAKAVVVEGVDADGDYSTSKDGERLHWVITDAATGAPIEAA